jgi:anti-sigma B factor antagonist
VSTTLSIDSRLEGPETGLLSLTGEVDVANAPEFRQSALHLLAGGAKRLVVDLTGITYMDSSGLGALVGLLKRLKESGGKLAIAGPQPQVKRLFEITGLNQVFPLFDDVGSALREVGA